MGITKMFRDRVVSMEQTFELGEKHLKILDELVAEAFPGSGILSHELDAEADLFSVTVGGESGRARRISFTRMVLSDPTCVPALAQEGLVPVRERLLAALRSQATRDEVLVTFRAVMSEEDRRVGEDVDAEWRKKEAAAAEARRLEEERKAEERRCQRQQEQARQQARQKKQRPPQPRPAGPSPGPGLPGPGLPGPGGARKKRRRGRGGQAPQGGPPGQPGQPGQRQGGPPGPVAAAAPAQKPRPAEVGAPAVPGGGGRRRKRRRRRGAGGGGTNSGEGTPF